MPMTKRAQAGLQPGKRTDLPGSNPRTCSSCGVSRLISLRTVIVYRGCETWSNLDCFKKRGCILHLQLSKQVKVRYTLVYLTYLTYLGLPYLALPYRISSTLLRTSTKSKRAQWPTKRATTDRSEIAVISLPALPHIVCTSHMCCFFIRKPTNNPIQCTGYQINSSCRISPSRISHKRRGTWKGPPTRARTIYIIEHVRSLDPKYVHLFCTHLEHTVTLPADQVYCGSTLDALR